MKNLINLLIGSETTIVSLLVVFGFLCLLVVLFPRGPLFVEGKRGVVNKKLFINIPRGEYPPLNLFRSVSLAITFVPLFWSLWLWVLYDGSGPTFQCICNVGGPSGDNKWGILGNLHLSFGIDATGLALVLLTSAIFPLCVALMRTVSGILTFLVLEWVILGSLLILDLLGFYIMFEASLILLFLVIARPSRLTTSQFQLQHTQRLSYGAIDAAYKIVLYTMAGSLIFLPVIFILYSNYGTTNLLLLTCSNDSIVSVDRQIILGWGLFAVFAIKIPLIPVHLWLPEAHVAAPTAGSVLLAGVLLKLGGIGIIRYLIPIFPAFVVKVFPLIALLCFVSFLYSTLSTLRQVDLKKIVAYSSIAHMALVTLTIFSMSEYSAASSTFMMIAHGIVSPGLFLLVGFLYERSHTKFLPYFYGLGSHMPIYATLFFMLTLANLSFPLFPNFIAEVLCLLSLFAVHSLYAYIFCISQVLGAVYSFWAYNRVMSGYISSTFYNQGDVSALRKRNVVDLSRRELSFITPIMIGVFWLGLKPMA